MPSADTAVLLGQMTARLAGRLRTGTEYQVVAWLRGRDGRKLTAGSALLGPDGEVLAAARALWITVPRAALTPAAEPSTGRGTASDIAIEKTAGGSA